MTALDREPPRDDSEAVVALHGEIDASSADAIHGAANLALRNGYCCLVLDLAGVTFIDSQGVNALINARETLVGAGGRLVVQHPSEAVRQIVTITGVDAIIDIR